MNRARITRTVATILAVLILLPFTAPFQTVDLNGQPAASTRSGAQTLLVPDDDGPAALPIVIERWKLAMPSVTAAVHASFFSLVVTSQPFTLVAIRYAPRQPAVDALRI